MTSYQYCRQDDEEEGEQFPICDPEYLEDDEIEDDESEDEE